MDPNTTLRELRDAVHRMCIAGLLRDLPTFDTAVLEIAELFIALDTWLSKGGFPPDAWIPSTK